mgnify:CR=1 FL=1
MSRNKKARRAPKREDSILSQLSKEEIAALKKLSEEQRMYELYAGFSRGIGTRGCSKKGGNG